MACRALRFILGDQLSLSLSALRGGDPAHDVILMAEVAEEAGYVRHHKKKLIFVMAAMRAFAQELRGLGWRVDYVTLDCPENSGSLSGELARARARWRPERVVAAQAAEWRVLAAQRTWDAELLEDDRFVCGQAEFAAWAAGRKQQRMEYFYREMRRKTGLLMEDGAPAGGQWNFDQDNRKPAKPDLFFPEPLRFAPDASTQAVISLVEQRFPENFGDAAPFWFPVSRAQAEAALDYFLRHALPGFGDYQDAMLSGHKFLCHSLLSPLLNVGLLDPLEVCRRAEAEFAAGRAPLNAVEGFIRQIIGWREYVRGIYWLEGPDYTARNALGAARALPSLYWTGRTRMACMAACIGQTRSEAYAHHIQRLMVTGNFALLAGVNPFELHEWYLAVYADAYEWVEAPNTLGMSQYADGGLLASKPYAASGAYIDRMSDYCRGCRYDVKARTGAAACPFNALYWDFISRHAERFGRNPRMANIVRAYERFDGARKQALADQAARFLAHVEQHGDDMEWMG